MPRFPFAVGRRPEERPTWPDGSPAALSLSFDDGRESQVTRGLDLLDELDVKATFFALPSAIRRNRRKWRIAVECGHEIGNHSTHHPCAGTGERGGGLEEMTLADIEADIDEADRRIMDLLGVTPRVFAYPCGQTFVGRGVRTESYVPVIARRYLVGRAFNQVWANAPLHCDLAQVATINSDMKPLELLRPELERALERGSWIVLGGHEIGDDGEQTTRTETIETIVAWCRDQGVRIDTVGGIGETVAALQQDRRPDGAAEEDGNAQASSSSSPTTSSTSR